MVQLIFIFLIVPTPFAYTHLFSRHPCKILIEHKCKDLILGSQICFIDPYMFSLLSVHVCHLYANVLKASARFAILYSSASSMTICEIESGIKAWFQSKNNMEKSSGPKHTGHSGRENSFFV